MRILLCYGFSYHFDSRFSLWDKGDVVITYSLPSFQVQTSKFYLHISYLLQNYKKGKPPKKDLLFSKIADMSDLSQVFEVDAVFSFAQR